jgi:D-ribulokinase
MASGTHPDAAAAMAAMSGTARLYAPATGALAALHDRRYAAFAALQQAARDIRRIIAAP